MGQLHPVLDFTLKQYNSLLRALKREGYSFQRVEDYIQRPIDRAVILRHDVDSWPANAMQMAIVEAETRIVATYFFRKSALSFNEKVVKGIIELGHEIGYHYEDLAACKGDMLAALARFQKNLEFYRQFYPISTIAMHGRPLSRWDSKDIWKHFDYHDYGLIAEPYLDIDFSRVAYFTDTGNCWDGEKYSVRDHVQSPYKFNIHTTWDLIEHVENNLLPDQIMLNIHPARWNDNYVKWWIRYYVLTLPKFQLKKMIKKKRSMVK